MKHISRRRVLAGLGATGVGSVGGLALLTEDAKAYPNSASIASTPLQYDWRETYNGRIVDGGTTVSGTESGPRISVSNVLPGDRGTLSVRLGLGDDAPAETALQPFLSLELTSTAENGINDAEADFDQSQERGELQEFLSVSLWYDTGAGGVDAFGAENGHRDMREELVHPEANGSLTSVAEALSTPTLLDPGEADLMGDSCLSDEDSLGFVLAWSFDDDTGPGNVNVTQSDAVRFDMDLTVEQCD